MKKAIFFGAAAIALLAGPASAQPRAEAGAGITRDTIEARVAERFARVDRNRDGFVTQEEVRTLRAAARAERQQRRGERREALFARLDANRDGSISRDEFNAHRPRAEGDRAEGREARFERREGRRGHRFARAHRRGAGVGMQAFARMDADRDGRVSLPEATAFRLERFERIDSDRDGRISPEERRSVREQRRGARRRG